MIALALQETAMLPASDSPYHAPEVLGWVEAAQGGDQLAFGNLVERFQRDVYGKAFSILKNHLDADDVVQETFLRLWSRHKENPPESIAPWLFTVCRNCALDVLRKENRMNPLDEDKLENQPADGKNPRQAVEEQETGTHLARALHKLPFKQQEVLRLKFQENLSYREISQVTGYTETNVGFLIHTAIRSLRQDMQAGH